jgi:type I restriction enzyme S subunit
MREGLVDQASKFKKRIASADTSSYKVVFRDELVVGFPIDEGVLSFQDLYDQAIVSPAYDIWQLKRNAEIEPRYLERFLRSPVALRYYSWKLRGTTARRRTLPDDVFLMLEVPRPSLAEQRRIADVLDKADAIRRKRKEAIALTDELLRSTFLEMFGDPVSNPKSWDVMSVSDVCESKQYGTAEKANSDRRGLPVLRMNNLTYSGDIDTESLKWVELPARESAKLDLRDGDVLFNRVNSHELVGKTAAWHGGDGYTFAGYLIRLRMKPRLATGDYVAAAMNMPSMKRRLAAMAKPSINMANISGSDLDRLHIPVPPLVNQRRFDTARRRIDELRTRYKVSINLNNHLFDSLVARAFSGELSVADSTC